MFFWTKILHLWGMWLQSRRTRPFSICSDHSTLLYYLLYLLLLLFSAAHYSLKLSPTRFYHYTLYQPNIQQLPNFKSVFLFPPFVWLSVSHWDPPSFLSPLSLVSPGSKFGSSRPCLITSCILCVRHQCLGFFVGLSRPSVSPISPMQTQGRSGRF